MQIVHWKNICFVKIDSLFIYYRLINISKQAELKQIRIVAEIQLFQIFRAEMSVQIIILLF